MHKADAPAKFAADFRLLAKVWPFLKEERRFVIVTMLLIPVVSLLAMALPLVTKHTIDEGVLKGDYKYVTYGATVYFVLVVSEYLVRAAQTLLTARSVHRMVRNMRMHLVRHVLTLAPKFHDQNLSGALVTRATSDFDNLSESLNQGVLTAIVDVVVLTGAVVGLFVLDAKLALSVLVILPLVSIIVVTFSKAMKKAMLAARVKIAALNAYTQECLMGSVTIKLLNAQKYVSRKFLDMAIDYRDAQMRSVVLDAFMFSVLDGISAITLGVVLWFAISQIPGQQDNAVSLGVMVAFVSYIQNIFEPLKQLGNKIAMMQGVFTSLDRIFSLLERTDFIQGTDTSPLRSGHIKFDNVSFSYQGKDNAKKQLNGINFEVKDKGSLAIVGKTGSGKTTIIKLLSKMYEGYEGRITIDGTDIAAIDPHYLRQNIAIVPQDVALFEGTIAFNVSLGEAKYSDQEIEQACRLVGAHDFISALPQGYQTSIREGGHNLSQGQRQLIAFARALLKRPVLVILDEATSAIDPVSEQAIQKATLTLLKSFTVIVIAHRLSTIKHCDEIILIDKGTVSEHGSHDELLDRKRAYFNLYNALAT
ncbi:MAG: ABC transporter ATP-binding protein [Oligoflexales bacterium]